jgi:hypothetical protein
VRPLKSANGDEGMAWALYTAFEGILLGYALYCDRNARFVMGAAVASPVHLRDALILHLCRDIIIFEPVTWRRCQNIDYSSSACGFVDSYAMSVSVDLKYSQIQGHSRVLKNICIVSVQAKMRAQDKHATNAKPK